ncbi:nitrate- and nitrite sensing domain-containing protein [Streptomyces sp. NPDC051322]|uniref:sensor histidine kinase n=1 Tax=Streptomyces sp. NPDC051322 TaxID=3154645 RepID=UPI00344C0800
MGPPQAHQGRGEAAAQEPRGGTDRGSSPQHAQAQQNHGPASAGAGESKAPKAPRTAPSASPKPAGPVNTGSRIALRNWHISTKLVALLTLPVVASATLGGLKINESLNNMQQLDHMQLLTQMTKQATELAAALQEERDKSAGPLAHGASVNDFNVAEPRKKTDLAYTSFIDGTSNFDNAKRDDSIESIRNSLRAIATKLGRLKGIRSTAYRGDATISQTVTEYSELINSLLGLSQDMAQATANPEMIKRTRALAAFSSAKEYASEQRAVISAALPPNKKDHGHLDESDRLFAESALQSEGDALDSFSQVYRYSGDPEALTAPLDTGNPEITAAGLYAKHVLENKNGLASQAPRSYKDWYDADTNRITAMNTIEATLLGEMEQKARSLRNDAERAAIINAALIVLILGVSLVGAFVVARSMIRSLRRLQDTATKVAGDRLPELVKQLSDSDPQDVDTSVESVGVHSRDEIGQVAAAFDDVHREAVRLASEQAMLRGNVNAMFTNLSRRSQGLIQRQLSLISELESREADPDQLSSLFKLDHLATRMRRNGENLLVLAGEEPGRRWTRPVPLVDVLRAAASEVEQYERIELAAVPATEVAGRVVNDLVHLLAELLENATSFSSPQTKVRVTGHALPDGRVLVEIHDTGIGLSPEDLAAINERLASPPTVDVSVSRRMGLFVVGRLSLRHGIRIQLRPSDSGGTTALVMLPVDVAQGGKKAPAKPGGPAQQQMPQQPAGSAGRLNAGAQHGQVSGPGPRAALPARDGDRSIQPGGPQPQGGAPQRGLPQGAPAPAPAMNAFGAGAPMPRRSGPGSDAPGRQNPGIQNPGIQNQDAQNPGTPGSGRPRPQQPQHGGDFPPPAGRQQQLPPTGPRAELPGGNPQPQAPQRPQTTSWGSEQPSLPPRSPDAPRGHEEADSGSSPQYRQPLQPRRPMNGSDDRTDRQGPGSTAEFQRPDFNAPPPQQDTGQFQRPGQFQRSDLFERPDVRGPQQPRYQEPRYQEPPYEEPQRQEPPSQDAASTTQFPRPDFNAPRPPAPSDAPGGAPRLDGSDFGAPRPPAPHSLPQQPDYEALPPASDPGDGRTPLYDTLETNWFHGAQSARNAEPQAPSVPEQPTAAAPQAPRREPVNQGGPSTAWRSSPNDELVRQAERAKKPAAGGVTTSGLPRRVPRANLVPGTAQQQAHQAGPQVSRAPDDVRGRLTNLRRGIQQGRQAGTGPSHQQEH